MVKKQKRNKGFTLVEIAIVLTVAGILLYAAVNIGAARYESSRIVETQKRLDVIENALSIYVKSNHKFPCPANGTAAVGSASFGVSAISGVTCNANFTTGRKFRHFSK